jgi:nucleotide-binding universal stress UspA family protein
MTVYKKVMVPLDGSKVAECVLPHLETIVSGCQDSPEITLVRAVEPISVPVGREMTQFSSLEQVADFEVHQKTDAERYLKEKIEYLRERGVRARSEIVFGKAGAALTDFAHKNSFDLIIIATHGRSGITRLVWGSVAEHILRNVNVPVLMVRAVKTAGV